MRVRVRVLAAHLGVERRRDIGLVLQTIVVAVLLLRRQVLVLVVAGLAIARTLLAPVLAGVTMQGTQHRYALIRILLEPRGLRSRQGWHEVRQPVRHRRDGLLTLGAAGTRSGTSHA